MARKGEKATVYYTTKRPDSVCPIAPDLISEPIKGNVYMVDGKPRSFYGTVLVTDKRTGVVSTERATIKSAQGFGYNIETAYTALNHWRNLGYRGSPASMASFTREKFKHLKNKGEIVSKCNASANNMIRDYFTGGWIETAVRGHFMQPIWHYDINKAYMSAAEPGLPSMLYPYNGDPDALGYVVLMEPDCDVSDLPNFLAPFNGDRVVLVTSEDVETYGITGKVIRGVQYYDLNVNLMPILSELKEELPISLWKKCTQTFWGMFASHSGLDIQDYESGAERKLWNRNQNIVWASLIVRRVAQKVYRVWKKYDGISCFVDSIITAKEIDPSEVSEEIGSWKLEGHYKKGAYFEGAGVWHPLPFISRAQFRDRNRWHKHSGFK